MNPVLLLAVPLGLAFLVPLLGLFMKRTMALVPILVCLFNLILALMLLPDVMNGAEVVEIGGFPAPFCINLYAGPAGVMFAALIALAGLGASIYSIAYIRSGSVARYHVMFLLLLTGATGVVMTGDLFNLFVFFEILCISSYGLVGYFGDRNGLEAATKYLIQGSIGSGLLLMGIGLLYGMFGTLNIAQIASSIGSVGGTGVFVPMALIVSGLGVEAAIFPLNAWLPDAHSSAPSPISAILSGIAIEVGLFAVARMVFTMFGAGSFLVFLLLLGVLTLLLGELCAYSQRDVKRMLAYSSIGQIGLVLFAISIASTGAVTGGLFQLLNHTLGKALLFLAAGYMIYRSGSREVSSLSGMGRRMPVTSLAFTVGAFSIVGLPPFAGFPSKLLIATSVMEQGRTLLSVMLGLVLVGTLIEGAYFFRVVQTIYFRRPPEGVAVRERAPVMALVPMILFAALIILIGVYPDPFVRTIGAAADELLDRAIYIGSVLR